MQLNIRHRLKVYRYRVKYKIIFCSYSFNTPLGDFKSYQLIFTRIVCNAASYIYSFFFRHHGIKYILISKASLLAEECAERTRRVSCVIYTASATKLCTLLSDTRLKIEIIWKTRGGRNKQFICRHLYAKGLCCVTHLYVRFFMQQYAVSFVIA